MEQHFTLHELSSKSELLEQFPLIQEMYPKMTMETYSHHLDKMLELNYKQVIVKVENKVIGLSGFWVGTKLWCGDYLELDNVIVTKTFRGSGAGKLLANYLEEKAKQLGCSILALDAFVGNFKAHRFYYDQGYAARGYHFVKILNESRLS